MQYNPKRFVSHQEGASSDLQNETLASDTQLHFMPWATGQRVCPGKKFSQVEVVAALAVIFRDYTVQPALLAGETVEQALKRVFQTGMEIDHEGHILHEIRHPEKIALTWTRRE